MGLTNFFRHLLPSSSRPSTAGQPGLWTRARDRLQGWLYFLGFGSPPLETRLAEIQERLRASSAAAQPPLEEWSGGYLDDVEERASRLGLSVSELLKRDWAELRARPYPETPCLQPDELEQLVGKGLLESNRQAHLDGCCLCQALVARARLNPEQVTEVALKLAQPPDLSGTPPVEVLAPGTRVQDFERAGASGQVRSDRRVPPLPGRTGQVPWISKPWAVGVVAVTGLVIVISFCYPELLPEAAHQVTFLRDARTNLAHLKTEKDGLVTQKSMLVQRKADLEKQVHEGTTKLQELARHNEELAVWKERLGKEKAEIIAQKNKFEQQANEKTKRMATLEQQATEDATTIKNLEQKKEEALAQLRASQGLTALASAYLGYPTSVSTKESRLASVDWLGRSRFWDIHSGKVVDPPRLPAGRLTALSFAPDSNGLAIGTEDGATLLWDPRARKSIWKEQGSRAAVTALAFSRDGKWLAMGSVDGTILVRNAHNGHRHDDFFIQEPLALVTSVTFSRDGKRLAVASLDRTVRFFSSTGGVPVHPHEETDSPVTSVSFSTRKGMETLAVAQFDGTIRVLEMKAGSKGQQILRIEGSRQPVCALSYSQDGKSLVAAGLDGVIRLLDAESGKSIQRFVWDKEGVDRTLLLRP